MTNSWFLAFIVLCIIMSWLLGSQAYRRKIENQKIIKMLEGMKK